MRINFPAFLEVKPDMFRPIQDCAYAEVIAARERETDRERHGQLTRLLLINGNTWKQFPLMTVQDMTVDATSK